MHELCDIDGGPEQEDDVVERHGADEVQEEPRLEVTSRDLARFQDNLVGEVVRYDACMNDIYIYIYILKSLS